ncbi:hypothetical protein JRQ81_000177 [Phrynocephalus forsythii]|uniref:Transmembrane protein 109 n=1 Tax=Phrynocephalus forsythii TaxID=171643 RepID=A0A9Q0Y5J7_9SAUR|nr:hypothetical protein JRQ81_000177 [Phrynocephalus forsythii]
MKGMVRRPQERKAGSWEEVEGRERIKDSSLGLRKVLFGVERSDVAGRLQLIGWIVPVRSSQAQARKTLVKTTTRRMSGRACILWTISKSLMQCILAVAMLLSLIHVDITTAQHHRSEPWREKRVEPDFLTHATRTVRKTVEDLIGKDNFKMLSENLSSLSWIVSSGISSALFVVARIVGQFLISFGMAGDHLTQFLKLSPEEVQTLLLWGLAALVGYWVLSLLLSLVLAVLSRIMWGLKVVLFGACFVFIVSAVPDRSVQVLLLLALLTLYVLLGWLSGSHRSGARLEAKVHSLERQVEELLRKQRRSPKHLEDE